jgi:hypothetical protein
MNSQGMPGSIRRHSKATGPFKVFPGHIPRNAAGKTPLFEPYFRVRRPHLRRIPGSRNQHLIAESSDSGEYARVGSPDYAIAAGPNALVSALPLPMQPQRAKPEKATSAARGTPKLS